MRNYSYLCIVEKNYNMRKYNFNEHYFDNIDCQEKAYWLGFFAADGYNHRSKGCIEFRLHRQDREILERFKSCL